MFDVVYILYLAIGGAFCGIVGLIGDSCAITRRAVYSAALQGMLFGTFTTVAIDSYVGTQFSGLAISIGGLIAVLRMKLIIPLCNILIKVLYDVLFALIQRINRDK